MSAVGSGAASGVVLGIVLVLLGQQFGWLDLSELTGAVLLLVLGGVVGGVVGALIGWQLGRRYVRAHPVAPS